MALIQAILAGLLNSAGKILNTVFGWATMLLFGRSTESKQVLISIASLGSVIWIFALIGMVFPAAGLFLIAAFVPKSIAAHKQMVQLGMLAGVVLIPFLVGFTLLLGKRDERATLGDRFKQVCEGWPYTTGLSLTMLLMLFLAPVMKLSTLAKRWKSVHVPVVVAPSEYVPTTNDVESALEFSGIHAIRTQATWMIRFPTRVLLFFAKNQFQGAVADQLTVFKGAGFEVMLHPSDLIISGTTKNVARLQTVLAERLAFSHAALTWEEKAMSLEKRMKILWLKLRSPSANVSAVQSALRDIERALKTLDIEHPEWEVLYREKAQIEHAILEQINKNRLRRAS